MPSKNFKNRTAAPKDGAATTDQEKLYQVQLQMESGTTFNDAVDAVMYDAAPYSGLRSAMQYAIYPPGPVPVLSPDQAEMDDILTKGMIQTYREDIKPLLVTSSKSISSTN